MAEMDNNLPDEEPPHYPFEGFEDDGFGQEEILPLPGGGDVYASDIIRPQEFSVDETRPPGESAGAYGLSTVYDKITALQEDALVKFMDNMSAVFNALRDKPPEDGEDRTETLQQAVTNEHDVTTLHQTLDADDFRPMLEDMGLVYEGSGFMPALHITDGLRFTGMLADVDYGTPVIQGGTETVVYNSLKYIANGYMPQESDDTYTTFHSNPRLQPHIIEAAEPHEYFRRRGSLFRYAEPIAGHMDRLGIRPDQSRLLRFAAEAHDEAMLGEWAVAFRWRLYQAPTTNAADREWTMWDEPEDWIPCMEFVGSVVAKAGTDSPFARRLVGKILEHVRDYRIGILEPEAPSPSEMPGVLDNVLDIVTSEPIAGAVRRPADDPRYESLLLDIEERLRRYLPAEQ